MLRRFLHNTAISAVAYGLAGVLGLMAVGAIARFYGVAVLGLIVLTRSFLPSGFLVLFDFGVSELATQAIARGRVGDWHAASEKVTLLTVIASVIGVVSAVVLYLAAAPLTALFLGAFAENKVQGFALMKGASVIMIPPMVAYFVPMPWQLVFGLVPTYWTQKGVWVTVAGDAYAGLYFAVGIVYELVLVALLYRRFRRRAGIAPG